MNTQGSRLGLERYRNPQQRLRIGMTGRVRDIEREMPIAIPRSELRPVPLEISRPKCVDQGADNMAPFEPNAVQAVGLQRRVTEVLP